MKITITTVLLLAGAVNAIALAEPAANAVADADARKGGRLGFCGPPGAPCGKVKREAEAEPKKKNVYKGYKAKGARGGRLGFCGPPGAPCGKVKRDASASASADADARKGGRLGFCGPPGAPCGKVKRAALAVADAFAESDPEARKGGRLGFCGPPGAPCGKARRSINDIGELAERSFTAVLAREADADARTGGRLGFCGPPGAPCGKVKREAEAKSLWKGYKAKGARGGRLGFCGAPGTPCGKVKRDVAADAVDADLETLASSIDAFDPEFNLHLCYEDDGECTAILKARNAVAEVKREVAVEDADEEDDESVLDQLQAMLDAAAEEIAI
jgi:ABC-type molybdate transport system substrate-binding protein